MIRRLYVSLPIAIVLAALQAPGVLAASRPAPAHTPAIATAHRPPRVFMINPNRVNLQTQPNIVLQGQNLTPSTQVMVGNQPATTVQADGYSMVVQLPSTLQNGTYQVEVRNEAGTAMADDPLTVDDTPVGPSQTVLLLGVGGLGALLILLMRMARSPLLR